MVGCLDLEVLPSELGSIGYLDRRTILRCVEMREWMVLIELDRGLAFVQGGRSDSAAAMIVILLSSFHVSEHFLTDYYSTP